jgi:hypothetical protein
VSPLLTHACGEIATLVSSLANTRTALTASKMATEAATPAFTSFSVVFIVFLFFQQFTMNCKWFYTFFELRAIRPIKMTEIKTSVAMIIGLRR